MRPSVRRSARWSFSVWSEGGMVIGIERRLLQARPVEGARHHFHLTQIPPALGLGVIAAVADARELRRAADEQLIGPAVAAVVVDEISDSRGGAETSRGAVDLIESFDYAGNAIDGIDLPLLLYEGRHSLLDGAAGIETDVHRESARLEASRPVDDEPAAGGVRGRQPRTVGKCNREFAERSNRGGQ